MATPLTRGKPYFARFTHIFPTIPVENDTFSNINIGSKYSFTGGNSVIIKSQFTSSRFEAVVDSYDSSTGVMSISEITNILGDLSGIGIWTITLAGQRGSKITSGSGVPVVLVGRPGDMYIDTDTGQIYLKS